MSEHKEHGATTVRASKHHDEGGGGGGKWLLGALAAAVLAGGGYFAYKAMGPGQTNIDTAYNDSYVDDEPLRAGPVGPADDPSDSDVEIASADAGPAPASARAPRSTPRAAPARTAERDAVPEETVGITPISASSDYADTDEGVIVRAPRRPVWTSRPSERRLTALYPTRALESGREGEARLSCTVLDGGSLDCARVEETSRAFGAAAVRVARQYRHAETLADGSSAVGTPVNMRVVFRIEEEQGRNRSRYASR